MGRSLYSRIHLGRRRALFNIRRLRAAAGVLTLGVAAVACVIVTFQ